MRRVPVLSWLIFTYPTKFTLMYIYMYMLAHPTRATCLPICWAYRYVLSIPKCEVGFAERSHDFKDAAICKTMRTTFKDIVCIERSVHAAICKTRLWVNWEKCCFLWLVYSVFYTLFTLEIQYCFKKMLFSLQTDTVRYWYAGQKSVLQHLLRTRDFFQKDAVLLSHRLIDSTPFNHKLFFFF